jgi:uncharacterized membrane protein
MTEHEHGDQGHPRRARYGRDTPEFARVANLSDAVFAIAMTLLVLTLDVPDMSAGPLAEALWDRLPQLIAFVLAFALVANIWWAHHRFVALLASFERGLIAITLTLLGAVALVPYPTSLIGNAPTDRAAVLPFIGLFVVTLTLFLLLFARAQAVAAWRRPIPDGVLRWVLANWWLNIGAMVLAFVVAVWVPVAGLAIAALSGTAVGLLMAWLAPSEYGDWSV